MTKSRELKKLKSLEPEFIKLAVSKLLAPNIIFMSMMIVEPYTTQTANLVSHCLTIFKGPKIQKRMITIPKTIDQT
jgi:hypothetical protein